MSIKAVLFDLDGTLLPMDQDKFIGAYFKLLTMKMVSLGYDAERFGKCLWAGVGAMIKNDGSCLNAKRFWDVFTGMFGEEAMKDKVYVDEFYQNEFQQVQNVCGFDAEANEIVVFARECGKQVILATNPLFPPAATESRMRWAGLAPEDFDYYTVYDNSTYCKPNLKYYLEILEKTGLKAEECLMVGNDVSEDMITETLGMQVFLLTDCLINKENVDISKYPHGGFGELREYIKSL